MLAAAAAATAQHSIVFKIKLMLIRFFNSKTPSYTISILSCEYNPQKTRNLTHVSNIIPSSS